MGDQASKTGASGQYDDVEQAQQNSSRGEHQHMHHRRHRAESGPTSVSPSGSAGGGPAKQAGLVFGSSDRQQAIEEELRTPLLPGEASPRSHLATSLVPSSSGHDGSQGQAAGSSPFDVPIPNSISEDDDEDEEGDVFATVIDEDYLPPVDEDSPQARFRAYNCMQRLIHNAHSELADQWALRNMSFNALEDPYSNEELLAGKHIEDAFEGSRVLDRDPELVNRATRQGRSLATIHPVPVLGRFGQGKSTLINSLLEKHEAETGRYSATTKGVDIFPMETNCSMGDILFCDTPGWEPGKQHKVLEQYTAALQEKTESKELLFPDVTLFVVAGTPQGMRELHSEVEGHNLANAFRNFRMPDKARGALLPVVTFGDSNECMATQEEDLARVRRTCEVMRKEVKGGFEIFEPAVVSNTNKDGIDELRDLIIDKVRETCERREYKRPWLRALEDGLITEVQAFELNHQDAEHTGDLFQRTIRATAYLYGQDADFDVGQWHLLPTALQKIQRGAGAKERCCERLVRRPILCLLLLLICTLVPVFLLAYLLAFLHPVSDYIVTHVGGGSTATAQGTCARQDLDEAVLRTFRLDISQAGGNEVISPLFARAGVGNLQLRYHAHASDNRPALQLFAPDGVTGDFTFAVDGDAQKVSGTFPGETCTVSRGGGIGIPRFMNVTSSAPSTATFEILNTRPLPPLAIQNHKWMFTWDIADKAGTNEMAQSSTFNLVGEEASLKFYPTGAPAALDGSFSLYLCMPGDFTVKYRLWVDGTYRTYTSSIFSSSLFGEVQCDGPADFGLQQSAYSIAGVEVLSVEAT